MARLFLIICGFLVLAMSAPATASILDLPETEEASKWLSIIMDGNIIGSMSVVLNTGCMLFSGIIIGYTALAGILNTAHEGNIMGKAYNSMWVPLRTTLALAMMLPFANGFSAMQYGVFYFVGAGAGLASTVWSAAVDHLANNGTIYAPPMKRNGEKLAAALMRNSACIDAINRSHQEMVVGRVPENNNNSDEYSLIIRYTGDGPSLLEGQWYPYISGEYEIDTSHVYVPINGCGTASITFQHPDEDDLSYPMKMRYMDEAQRHFWTLADGVYKFTYDLLQREDFRPTGRELQELAKSYDDAMAASAGKAVEDLMAARKTDLTWLTEAKERGFTSAGIWYFDISRLHEETFDFLAIAPATTAPMPDVVEAYRDEFGTAMGTVNKYLAARLTFDKYGNEVEAATQTDDEGLIDGVTNKILASIASAIENQQDPTLALKSIGHSIIEVLWVVGGTAAAAKTVAAAGESSFWVKLIPGGGATAGAANSLADTAFTAFVVIAFLLGVPALFLAFYLPAIPFILWVMGVIGWLVLVAQAIVAAPIWAAAHSIPDGQGAINQHARAGYMIMLSLFFRPTLMIFGLFFALLINIIGGKFALSAYLPMVLSVTADEAVGIGAVIAYTIILTVLMVMIAQRSYGLIHEIPDQILRYIGGGGEQLGEGRAESQGMQMIAGYVRRGERGKMPGGMGKGKGNGGEASGEANSLSGASKKLESSLNPAK